ncbi:MAG TPA: flavodoxin [Candidatus Blautia gallistercoris]|uniref:Flavodoxin n=1 Tax=Candidatus Blautia gallistercoris TaxID=2838490 RepID=A0A9D1WJ52_9FIRM|nr:flavodoxin [Candidatus Blautia gallistercoris]
MGFKKKYAAFALTAALAVSLGACGTAGEAETEQSTVQTEAAQESQTEGDAEGSDAAQESAESETGEGQTEDGQQASGQGSRILIAYFTAAENSGVDAVSSASYSEVNGEDKGRMQALAEMIQEETGGDLFSIRTDVVYPADGGELIDYAAQEQDEDARPELTSHIENLDDYDVIFVGYPNWWGDMPQALYSFFDEYDFSGKTIVPFNSHNGSRFSNTISTIAELEPDATVIEDGFTVNERDVPDAASDIADWVSGLDLD